MKKTLLSLAVIATGFMAQAQVICAGVSPANIVANYDHTWADPGGGDWATPDYLIPGNFVEDTLMLIDDGTAGTNAQGNPISGEGCAGSPTGPAGPGTWNDLTGHIAVIYRNTCEFGYKALQAQNNGAVGVIIINREDEVIEMGGGAEGLNVNIPVFFVSSVTGSILTTEMGNGPVVMFLGNKLGLYDHDLGMKAEETRISSYGGANSHLYNGFELATQIYNYGNLDQSSATLNATIVGPGAVTLYDQTINLPTMSIGDTIPVATGNTYFLPSFDLGGIGNYPAGDYTLTYTIDLGTADQFDTDNTLTSTFTVNSDVISLARIDGSGNPTATTYPSNSTIEYQSCMFFVDSTASAVGITGVTFIPHIDTTVMPLAGEEIFVNIYEWNDTWTDLTDPGPQTNNDWFTSLNPIGFEAYYPLSNNEVDQPTYVELSTPIQLVDDQRYLVCLQSFNPEVAFGYDFGLDYDGNQAWTAMPIAPVFVDDTWYTGGWVGPSAASISLHVADNIGIEDITKIDGKAFPNPANDVVTIAVEGSAGNAELTVTDVSGKVAMNESIFLANGNTQVNIDGLEPGIYVFNVALENGLSSQFNVIKE